MGLTALMLLSVALGLLSAVWMLRYYFLRKQFILQAKKFEECRNEVAVFAEKLKELERDKMHLSGVVSHDIRGPYNRIFALLQLLQMSLVNVQRDQKEYMDKIHIIIADALGMLRNLNDYQRLECDGMDYNPAELSLTPVLVILARNHKVIAEKKNIQFSAEIAPALSVVADKQFIIRIIDNLLSNAIKFCSEHKQVSLRTLEEESSISIEVRDEGPGILQEDHRKLFQKFQTLTAKPTRGETTIGLGLYVAKTLADKMGAELSCISETVRGTIFTLRIRK